jgi:choline dehydrogenase
MNHNQQTIGHQDRDHESTLEGYEYIIVGSGPGGGPLAANLARHGHSVLLSKQAQTKAKT